MLLVVEQPPPARRLIGGEVGPERRHEGDPSHSRLEVAARRDLAQRREVEPFGSNQGAAQQVRQVVNAGRLGRMAGHHLGMAGNDILPLRLVVVISNQGPGPTLCKVSRC